MPKMTFEIPEIKMSDAEKVSSMPMQPTIYLPINAEIADLVDVDDMVAFVVKGKVRTKRNVENAYDDGIYELDIDIKEVEFEDKNEFTLLAEDE